MSGSPLSLLAAYNWARRIEEASAYAEKRRSLFKTVSFAETSEGLLERLQPPEKTKDAPPEGGEDNEVRTLWVDTDEQGERFKRWRDVCQESYTPSYEQKPLDGPLTALHTMKHMERHGGDPRLWLVRAPRRTLSRLSSGRTP
eukprot:s7121_g1.t1